MSNNLFYEINEQEMMEIDGGLVILGITITAALVAKAVAATVVVGGAAALGVYNGYKDTKDQKK
ncbi:MAG: bacteriocin [Clostridium sp.]|nr:bacteriocin [Clostridium sp.]